MRLAYSLGATTNVKFEIYKILVRTSKGQIIDSYLLPNEIEDFNQYKMLRKGYALLAYYLDGGSLMEKYWYDKLLSNNDRSELTQAGWTSEQEDNAINSLCNTIAINIPSRRKICMINISISIMRNYFIQLRFFLIVREVILILKFMRMI